MMTMHGYGGVQGRTWWKLSCCFLTKLPLKLPDCTILFNAVCTTTFDGQGLCELAVQKGITAENSAAILHTSDDLRATRLRDICMRFVVRHFDTVSKSEVGAIFLSR